MHLSNSSIKTNAGLLSSMFNKQSVRVLFPLNALGEALEESKRELEKGNVVIKTLEELEAMENE